MPATLSSEVRHFPIRSTSRRGAIIVVDGRLVRITADTRWVRWEHLPQPASIAQIPGHQHAISCNTLPDGWDVVYCVTCGMEW